MRLFKFKSCKIRACPQSRTLAALPGGRPTRRSWLLWGHVPGQP